MVVVVVVVYLPPQAGDLFLEMIDALLAPNARGKEKPSGGQYHVNPKSLFRCVL